MSINDFFEIWDTLNFNYKSIPLLCKQSYSIDDFLSSNKIDSTLSKSIFHFKNFGFHHLGIKYKYRVCLGGSKWFDLPCLVYTKRVYANDIGCVYDQLRYIENFLSEDAGHGSYFIDDSASNIMKEYYEHVENIKEQFDGVFAFGMRFYGLSRLEKIISEKLNLKSMNFVERDSDFVIKRIKKYITQTSYKRRALMESYDLITQEIRMIERRGFNYR